MTPGANVGPAEYPAESGAHTSVLPNGLRVITRARRETRAIAMHLAVLAGSRDEHADTAGAAHVMEHFFFQGTERAPTPDDVVGPIVARGGAFNAATEREMIGFFVEAPASAAPVAFEQLGDVIVNASFDDGRLEKVRGVVIEELRRRANDPGQVARDVFHDEVLRGHPAQHSPGGTAENVRAIGLDALRRYRSERFRAGNMVLGVVGRLDHEDVVRQVETCLGAVEAGATPRERANAPAACPVRVERHAGRTAAHIVVGITTPGLDSPERYGLTVTAAILGRAGRRLRRELREDRALTYAVSARYGALTDVGIFSIGTAVEAERVDETLDVIRDELRRLRDSGVSKEELASAHGYLEGRTYLSEERNLAQARRIASQELLGIPQGLDQYVRAIQNVSRTQVHEMAQRYLDPDRVTVVVVKP